MSGRWTAAEAAARHTTACVGLLLACCILLPGCQRVTRDMADQPRGRFAGASTFFADGQSGRPPPADAVPYAMGDRAAISSGREGRVASSPSPGGDEPDLARGHARYLIFCAPCHGATGASDGEVVRRGFPRPVPFARGVPAAGAGAAASDPVAGAPAASGPVPGDPIPSDAAVRAIILQGRGVMPAFADRIDARDAAAIAAFVRTLR